MKKQKTYHLKANDIQPEWIVIDAADQILGRLATKVATLLRGKHKPQFTPSMETGDFVIVINSDHVKVTGKKEKQKMYYRHSGFPGGLKSITLEKQREKDSTKIIEKAVYGMLPTTKLRSRMMTKLKVYASSEHPHEAQQPKTI